MSTTAGHNPEGSEPLHIGRERLHELFQQAPGFMCVLRGPQHVYEIANNAYYQLVGHREIIGRVLAEALPEVVPQGFLDRLDRVYRTGIPFVGRAVPIQLQRVAGGELEQRYIDLTYQPIYDSEKNVTGIFVQGHDVSEAHTLAQEVTYQAAHDPLTGLLNRREFSRRTQQINGDGPHALLYLDLDHFKIVNDRCGHSAGDSLLLEMASTLKDQCDDDDLIARLGGDEFALLRQNCGQEAAIELANRLRVAAKSIDFVWETKRYGISLSVGVACFGEANELTFDHAFGLADAACFLAKERGRNRVQLATHSDEAVVQQHRDMDNVSLIKQAIQDNRIALVAQKIVGLRANEGEVPMYEVLARIRDVDGVLLAPSSFIAAAERFGLIEDLDHHIIRQAMAHVVRHAGSSPPATFFINVSGITLDSAGFPCFIDSVLNEFSDVEASRICFEVTETAAVANVRRTSAAMQELTKRGFRFALDDFGTGMASFSYLQKLPVQFVKIDGQFVQSILHDATNAAIVEAVVNVARTMNIATIAETVDRESLLPILRRMGVDFAQGFALHRPMPIDMIAPQSVET